MHLVRNQVGKKKLKSAHRYFSQFFSSWYQSLFFAFRIEIFCEFFRWKKMSFQKDEKETRFMSNEIYCLFNTTRFVKYMQSIFLSKQICIFPMKLTTP